MSCLLLRLYRELVTIGVGISLCLLYCVARCVVGCFQDFLITCCYWDPGDRRGARDKAGCLDKRDVIDIIKDQLEKRGHTRVPDKEPPPLTELDCTPSPSDKPMENGVAVDHT